MARTFPGDLPRIVGLLFAIYTINTFAHITLDTPVLATPMKVRADFFDRCGPLLDALLPDLCGSDVETLVARASARPNVKAPYVLQHYMLFSDSKIAAHSHPLRNQARFSHSFFSSFIRGDTSQSDTFLV